jgi:hypothetical protein
LRHSLVRLGILEYTSFTSSPIQMAVKQSTTLTGSNDTGGVEFWYIPPRLTLVCLTNVAMQEHYSNVFHLCLRDLPNATISV